MPFAMSDDALRQVLVTLIGAIVTIITTLSGLVIAYMNIRAKVVENTKLTREAAQTTAETHAEVVETKTALAETQAESKILTRTAAASARAAAAELMAARDEIKRLMENGGPKKPDGGHAG